MKLHRWIRAVPGFCVVSGPCLSTNRAQDRTRGLDCFATCMIDEKLRMWGRRTQVSPGTAVLNITSCSVGSIDSYHAATVALQQDTTIKRGTSKSKLRWPRIVEVSSPSFACDRKPGMLTIQRATRHDILLCVLWKLTDLSTKKPFVPSRVIIFLSRGSSILTGISQTAFH